MEPENLNGIYKDFAEHMGMEFAKLVFDNYKGLQVTFPVKFLSTEYVAEMIEKEYDGSNVKELARKYDCSERKVRNVLRERLQPGPYK